MPARPPPGTDRPIDRQALPTDIAAMPESQSIPPVVLLHLYTALVAVGVGIVVLWRPKGTPNHKLLGRLWVVLMLVVAFSSFGITELRGAGSGTGGPQGMSAIHILSVWTIIAIIAGLRAIRRGNRRAHKFWMIGTMIGLFGAGLGTLWPGRFIPTFVLGLFS